MQDIILIACYQVTGKISQFKIRSLSTVFKYLSRKM